MGDKTNSGDDQSKMVEAAKALGRRGGLKGGKARAAALSAEERSEIAKNAVEARWAKSKAKAEGKVEVPVPRATHGRDDHPIRIGDLEIPCFVLEDKRRVLAQNGMISALRMSHGSASGEGRDRLARFAGGKLLNPFIPKDLLERIENPIRFRQANGSLAVGYEATILADLCEVVLAARDAGVLQKQQLHIAQQCEILLRGFARVGIIALVDEATGYQEDRSRDALAKILEKFISKELVKWVHMFPDEFYEHMFRLRGWQYTPESTKRPVMAAQLTNDLVYSRLAPGVLEELQKITPKDAKGRRKHRYHQRLTEDVGHPRLREHLASVITLMKASLRWSSFYTMIQRAMPKYNVTMDLPFPDDSEDGPGMADSIKALPPPG